MTARVLEQKSSCMPLFNFFTYLRAHSKSFIWPEKSQFFSAYWAVAVVFIFHFPSRFIAQAEPYPIAQTHIDFKSCKLHPTGIQNAHPFIPLVGGQLTLSFDDLSGTSRQLEMRWKHCTFDWYDSPDLIPSDYIAGFPFLTFESIENSFNTKVPYTHYHTQFPNDLMRFGKSGNYIVEVYDPHEPERVLISRRFVVFENLIDIEMYISESSVIRDKRTHQEVDITLIHYNDRYSIVDAYDALQTVVLQNGTWHHALYGMEPQFVRGEEVNYNPMDKESFAGGNSWRFADLKSLRFASLGIARIVDDGAQWRVLMDADEPRTYAVHQARQDLDGHFVIANDRQEDDTGSDYVWVDFTLKSNDERIGEDIYIYGEISDWLFPNSHRMIWDSKNRVYKATLNLKQGYYNYLYVTRPAVARDKNDFASLTEFPGNIMNLEGSHARADNPYQVIAYYWDFSGYDRVIGFQTRKTGSLP